MVQDAYNSVFSSLSQLFATLIILCVIFVPLGMWKLIEIITWIFKHIKIQIF